MFAPSIASAQTKTAASRTNKPAPQRTTQPSPSLATRRAISGVPWDFSTIPTYPAEHANRRQAPFSLVQPKLTIGSVDDPLEHEADRIADQVMRMPGPTNGALTVHEAPGAGMQRACAKCEEESPHADAVDGGTPDEQDQEMAVDSGQPVVAAKQDQTEPLSPGMHGQNIGIRRTRTGGPDSSDVIIGAPLVGTDASTSEGRPLDSGMRTFFEQRFGHSFDHVRVHTGSRAAESTRAVNALAYTVGNAIVFGPGQYEPGTATGQRLLAHELTHVLQQGPSTGRHGSSTAAAGAVQVQTMATGVLQRWSANGPSNKATNTIVCDGKDGVRVQIGTANDAGSLPCLLDCLTRHEESHRSDALAANATVCKGKADGSQVNFGSGEQNPSEIRASQVEIDCLNAKLPAASDTCKPAIRQRITQMIAYRDSFK